MLLCDNFICQHITKCGFYPHVLDELFKTEERGFFRTMKRSQKEKEYIYTRIIYVFFHVTSCIVRVWYLCTWFILTLLVRIKTKKNLFNFQMNCCSFWKYCCCTNTNKVDDVGNTKNIVVTNQPTVNIILKISIKASVNFQQSMFPFEQQSSAKFTFQMQVSVFLMKLPQTYSSFLFVLQTESGIHIIPLDKINVTIQRGSK